MPVLVVPIPLSPAFADLQPLPRSSDRVVLLFGCSVFRSARGYTQSQFMLRLCLCLYMSAKGILKKQTPPYFYNPAMSWRL